MLQHIAFLLILFSTLFLNACGETENTRTAAPESTAADTATQAPITAAPKVATCKLVMGWDPYEPYQYQDVDGPVRGLDVELVTTIAEDAGCKVEFVEGRWSTLIPQLQEGTIDLLAGATRTSSRESFARFSAPYRGEEWELFVRRDEAGGYDFDSLLTLLESGFRIGVTEQYVYGDTITDLRENPKYADQFVGATIGELNYARLLDMAIDGFLEDPFVAARTFRSKGLDDSIEPHPLRVHSGDVNLMFSRKSVSEETLDRIDASIAAIKADGRHQAILDKYLE